MDEIDDALFAEMVAAALAEVPSELAAAMDNVEVLIEEVHDSEPDLLGLYEGVPLTERGDTYSGALPDRIFVYRRPLLEHCETVFELEDEVRITVLHEIAHHFGIDDDHLDEWGWA